MGPDTIRPKMCPAHFLRNGAEFWENSFNLTYTLTVLD